MEQRYHYQSLSSGISSHLFSLRQGPGTNVRRASSVVNAVHLSQHRTAATIRIPSKTQDVRNFVTITKTSADSKNNKNDNDSISQSQPSPNPIITKTTSNNTSIEDIHITDSCTKRIHQLAKIKNVPPSSLYLRIFVDPGGCSGFQYQFEIQAFDNEPLEDDDVQFHVGESSVVIDSDSLEMMKGSTIDYVTEMIRSGFKIVDNPLSESACGCGSSFAIKNFEGNR